MGKLTGPTEQCFSLLFLENRKEMVGSWPRLQRVGRGMGKLFWGRCKSGAVGRGIEQLSSRTAIAAMHCMHFNGGTGISGAGRGRAPKSSGSTRHRRSAGALSASPTL